MELSNVMVIEGPDKNSVSREVGTQLDQDRFKRKWEVEGEDKETKERDSTGELGEARWMDQMWRKMWGQEYFSFFF